MNAPIVEYEINSATILDRVGEGIEDAEEEAAQ